MDKRRGILKVMILPVMMCPVPDPHQIHTRSIPDPYQILPCTLTHTHRVILVGLLLASLSLAASGLVVTPTLAHAPVPLDVLLSPAPSLTAMIPAASSGLSCVALAASRVAFGFFSAAAMPAVSAMAAELVPQQYRSSATATFYAVFNLGGALIPRFPMVGIWTMVQPHFEKT